MLGPSLRMGPSPRGLKRLVPNYYIAFSCRPVGAVLRFPCEGGGHSSCNVSLSQPNIQWSDKTMKSTPIKKKLGIGSPVFCTFFIHPNQIT